ncbi:MAG: cellulase family glycosylhydrolase [Planctomycetota bacterium]|jgi:beta-glucanase (GH16 family)
MKPRNIFVMTYLVLIAASTVIGQQTTPLEDASKNERSHAGYKLIWADEFDKDGRPDPCNWTYERGFVRNRELQWYQPENARCENGLLIIEGRRQRKQNPRHKPNNRSWRQDREYAEYTSASLTTRGLHNWMYGRFEMRGRIDTRAGLWPAFWTLGANIKGWPACGEIDIMEYYRGMLLANAAWASEKRWVPKWDDVKKPIKEFNDPDWSTKFHIWRMDWDADSIKLYVDDVLLNTIDLKKTFNENKDGKNPFRQPHYIILNLAIGGTAGGDPTNTKFPAKFEVDYVRVYKKLSQSTIAGLEFIRPSEDGTGFVCAESGAKFVAWGFNYDHDHSGRLIEDYWHQEWPTIVEDFKEMKSLGANVVRIHLQVAKFMNQPEEPNEAALEQLARLVKLSEQTGLYLDLTGLGCYHKKDVPEWYDEMDEAERWDVQVQFWEVIAKTCSESPAIFCYDLMNEPIAPGGDQKQTEWLLGELGGKFFVQRITLEPAGRTAKQVAKAWVDKLTAAIRKHDERHMITVGIIPWTHTFPGAKPLFYSEEVGKNLDFASVHFYPKKGEVDKALKALAVYDVGKPLVVEEMFPLQCGTEELNIFIDGSRKITDGWIGFYWGKTIDEYAAVDGDLAAAITIGWLKYFAEKTPEILGLHE